MTAQKPVFLLGLGAQKAGTSWLHAQLSARPDANFGPQKEYHCFDAVYLPSHAHLNEDQDPTLFSNPRKFVRRVLKTGKRPRIEALRKRLRQDPEVYARFFRDLVDAEGGKLLTGDLTPIYGALPENAFRDIESALNNASFDVRAILIMRDPVERCLSATRMYMAQARVPGSADRFARLGMDYTVAGHPFSEHAELRTRYDLTLERAENSFGADRIFVSFYEEMFTPSEIGRLSDWLGLPPEPVDFEARVNESKVTLSDDDADLRGRVAAHYRPVYERMFDRFGEDRIRAIWPSAALLT